MAQIWIFAGAIIIAAAAVLLGFDALELNADGVTIFGQVLGTLLMLSAVLERALDVLLSIMRAEESDKLRASEQAAQDSVDDAQSKGEASAELQGALETAQTERAKFRAKTMRLAMGGGLIAGIVLSAIGIRILEMLTNPASVQMLTELQQNSFVFIDVVLTGAVLAGGSDGIHKLIEVYRNYTDKGSQVSRQTGAS